MATNKMVNVRLSEKTLDRIKILKEQLEMPNKATALSAAVKFSCDILKEVMEEGATLYLKYKDGTDARIKLI